MKKNLLKTTAGIAMAIVGGALTTSSPQVSNAEVSTYAQNYKAAQSETNQNTPVKNTQENLREKPSMKIENTYRPSTVNYYNEGIPPKIYGMYHAKRNYKR